MMKTMTTIIADAYKALSTFRALYSHNNPLKLKQNYPHFSDEETENLECPGTHPSGRTGI